MNCPQCQKEPLTRSQFIRKPQAVTLNCTHCGVRLHMAPETEKTAVLLVLAVALPMVALTMVGAIVTIRSATCRALFSDHPIAAALVLTAILLTICVGGAYRVRCLLWTKPYVSAPGR